MDPIKINVSVQIGVTEELSALLAHFVKPATAPTVAAEPTQKLTEKPATRAKKEKKQEAPQPAEAPAADEQPADIPGDMPEEVFNGTAQEVGAKEYTEVDVRAAMDKTRRRIEGEDYKDNTSSENYKKYHRQLTGQFKNIAALLGADKPSALPTSELRESFCKQCDELGIDNDGNIITASPPF